MCTVLGKKTTETNILIVIFKLQTLLKPGMVVHGRNPITKERSNKDQVEGVVQGWPRLHGETLSQKTKTKPLNNNNIFFSTLR